MNVNALENTKTDNTRGSGSIHEAGSILLIILTLPHGGYASIGSFITVNLDAIILQPFDYVDDVIGYLKETRIHPHYHFNLWLPGDNTYPQVEANVADCRSAAVSGIKSTADNALTDKQPFT